MAQASRLVQLQRSSLQTSTPPPLGAQRTVPGVQLLVQVARPSTTRHGSATPQLMRPPFHAEPEALQVSMLPLVVQRRLPGSQIGGGGGHTAVVPSLWQLTPEVQVAVVVQARPSGLQVSTPPPEVVQRCVPGAQMAGVRQFATPGPPQS